MNGATPNLSMHDATSLQPSDTAQPVCRVCGGSLNADFSSVVLNGIPVTYYTCVTCGTLQLPSPHWLEQAYAQKYWPDPDTGRLRRAQAIHRVIRRLRSLRLLPVKLRALDEGAGLGLLVRLLRDHGVEAWGHDPYATPVMAESYILPVWPEETFQLITATEVIEHTENPAQFAQALASRLDPKGILILTTELYESDRIPHPASWHYLAKEYGQHITFLSGAGLHAVAKQAGLVWWGSLAFAGTRCIHLLGRTHPSPWMLWKLKRRHTLGESRFANDLLI